jgi:hypothetical protein
VKNENIVCARCRRPILGGEGRIKEGIFVLCLEHKKEEAK